MRQNTKTIIGLNVTTTTTAATFSASFDTAGFSFAKIIALSASTEALPAASGTSGCYIVDGDTTSAFGTSPISTFVQGTDWTANTATNSTDTAKLIFAVDLRGRKRYIKPVITVTTGVGPNNIRLICELSNPGDGVGTATEAGAANAVGL